MSQQKYYACRVFGGAVPYTPTPLARLLSGIYTPPAGTTMMAGEVLPFTIPPFSSYAVNGTRIDSQPTTMTAPMATAGVIPTGSVFTLVFSPASSLTQTSLASGSTLTLRFGLADRSSVSGPVSVTSTLVGGNTLVAFFTTLAPITVGH